MLVICTEAGSGIGFGHLTRCDAIRETWIERGGAAQLLVNAGPEELVGTHLVRGDWIAREPREFTGLESDIEAILVDSYRAPAYVYARLSSVAPVAALDDFCRLDYPVELVVNPNVFGGESKYRLKSCRGFAGGAKYVVLRRAIREAVGDRSEEKPGHGLLVVGGSDYRDLIPKLGPPLLQELDSLTVIAGSERYADNLLHILPRNESLNVRGRLEAAHMADEFRRAEVVVSACGQTLHELAYLGKSVVGICIDADQEPNRDCYARLGYLSVQADWDNKDLVNKVVNEIRYLRNPSERRKRAKFGQRLIDAQGTERICRLIEQFAN